MKNEAKPPFRIKTARQHIKSLAIPRLAGSPGEEKAFSYIQNYFRSIGIKPHVDKFKSSDKISALSKVPFLLFSFLILLAAYSQPIFPLLSIALCVSFITYFSYASRNASKLARALKGVGKQAEYKNIVATLGPRNPKCHVIIGAHYDSISVTRNPFPNIKILFTIFAVSYIGLLISSVVIIVLSVLEIGGIGIPPASQLILIAVFGLAVLTTPCALIGRGNESLGAVDNASGVSVVLELARIFAKEKPKNIKLSFVAFAAEEKGILGSVNYLQNHQTELDPERTYVIVFDGSGGPGHMYYNESYGFPPRKTNGRLNNLIKAIARGSGIKVKSLWVPVGVMGDHFPFVEAGFRATGISTYSKETLAIVHSDKDTPDVVDYRNLKRAGVIGYELIRKIDSNTV
jgi:hypothetical protein